MAMSGMGMMAGMAAGQALIQALLGQGGAAGGMMGAGTRGGMRGAGMRQGLPQVGLPQFAGFLGQGGGFKAAQGRGQQSVWQAPAVPRTAEPFELVSKLPGRRRYRAAAMSEELAALLQQKLSELAFLKEVKVNAATGSLLFVFGPDEAGEGKMDELASFLRGHIFRPSAAPNQESGLPLEAHAGLLTKSIRGTVRDFSAWIKRNTGGWLDVSSAASLFFMFHGLQRMLANQQLPSGSQMFWWAVSLMRGWRTV